MVATPMKWLGWALPSVAILAVAGMSILPSQTAHAQFDISGDWNLEIRSDLGATMCTAGVSQTGASFDMSVKCSGVTAGSLAGDIDLETGVFSGTGTLRARLIHFEGSALPAGNLIVGTWTTKPPGPAGTFVGTRPFVPFTPTPIPTPTPRPTLPAPVDLSGTWDLEFSSASGGGTCIALIEQANSDMAMLAACDLVGAIDLMGAIDPETGAFTIAGEGVVMEGLSAADGNSFSGAWAYFDLIAGALNGQRSDEIELIDLSGDWKLVTELDVGATCDAEFAHVWIELTAYVDCGELGSGGMDRDGPSADRRVRSGRTPGSDRGRAAGLSRRSCDQRYVVLDRYTEARLADRRPIGSSASGDHRRRLWLFRGAATPAVHRSGGPRRTCPRCGAATTGIRLYRISGGTAGGRRAALRPFSRPGDRSDLARLCGAHARHYHLRVRRVAHVLMPPGNRPIAGHGSRPIAGPYDGLPAFRIVTDCAGATTRR